MVKLAPFSGLSFLRFEQLIQKFESVTRVIYACRIVPHNKIIAN